MKPRVFAVEPLRLDISQATKYGELVYMWGQHERRPSIWSDEFIMCADGKLQEMNFDAECDMLLIAGDIIPLVRIVAHMSSLYGRKFKALCWNSHARDYVVSLLGHNHAATTTATVCKDQSTSHGGAS